MGCDTVGDTFIWIRPGFNPRTRMGCDADYTVPNEPVYVSIHAPAWGATQQVVRFTLVVGFQSTHPHGVRQDINRLRGASFKFQSTHPHGVRRNTF